MLNDYHEYNTSYRVGVDTTSGWGERFFFTFYSQFGARTMITSVEVAALVIIFILSLVANMLVIVAICLFSEMRNSTNYFLLNLTLADLVFACSIPAIAYTRLTQDWTLGDLVCKAVPYSQFVCCFVLLWTLTLISMDRYQCIVIPPYRSRLTTVKTVLLSLLTWLVAMIIFVPATFLFRQQHVDDDRLICTIVFPKSKLVPYSLVFALTAALLDTLMPMGLMVYFYTRIVRKIVLVRKRLSIPCILVTTNNGNVCRNTPIYSSQYNIFERITRKFSTSSINDAKMDVDLASAFSKSDLFINADKSPIGNRKFLLIDRLIAAKKPKLYSHVDDKLLDKWHATDKLTIQNRINQLTTTANDDNNNKRRNSEVVVTSTRNDHNQTLSKSDLYINAADKSSFFDESQSKDISHKTSVDDAQRRATVAYKLDKTGKLYVNNLEVHFTDEHAHDQASIDSSANEETNGFLNQSKDSIISHKTSVDDGQRRAPVAYKLDKSDKLYVNNLEVHFTDEHAHDQASIDSTANEETPTNTNSLSTSSTTSGQSRRGSEVSILGRMRQRFHGHDFDEKITKSDDAFYRRGSDVSVLDRLRRKFSSNPQECVFDVHKSRQNSISHHEEHRLNKHMRVMRLIFLNVIVILVMWLPITVTTLLIWADGVRDNTNFFLRSHHFIWCLILALLNTVVNPVLYGVLSENFRSCFKKWWYDRRRVDKDKYSDRVCSDNRFSFNRSHENGRSGAANGAASLRDDHIKDESLTPRNLGRRCTFADLP